MSQTSQDFTSEILDWHRICLHWHGGGGESILILKPPLCICPTNGLIRFHVCPYPISNARILWNYLWILISSCFKKWTWLQGMSNPFHSKDTSHSVFQKWQLQLSASLRFCFILFFPAATIPNSLFCSAVSAQSCLETILRTTMKAKESLF